MVAIGIAKMAGGHGPLLFKGFLAAGVEGG
jgi:hypothetical protein